LFEPLDSITFSEIKDEILFTLNKYAPYVQVVGLRVSESSELNYTGIPGIVIQLTVKLRDDENQTFDVTVKVGE
jgi:hypothetical protein